MNKANLYYSYGEHHCVISCSVNSFLSIIDDLSEEFEIVKDVDHPEYVSYYVKNYLNELDLIGFVLN